MTALSVFLGLGAGLCLVGGPWAGRGAALSCILVGAFAAWSGAWAAVGAAIALATLLGRREEAARCPSPLWAPLCLCALSCAALAWSMAGTTSPPSPPPPGMASIEALRGERWLALGAAAMLVLAARSNEEEAP
ncbi:MAG: hypothetical protein IPI35_18425 [Deltaproteobacteria bacterium]|nr:hypothetical protein [Deltaproteobacteria bacterium]